MPTKRISNRLDEASNLSTEDKMTLWANGQRRENIKAAGDAKLDNFAGASIYLAERTKDVNFARRLLNNNIQALCSEFRARGLTSLAQKYEADYNRVMKKINGYTQDIDAFAKTAFDIIADKCKEEAGDLNALNAYLANLLDSSNLPKNLVVVQNLSLNLLQLFDKSLAINTLRGNYLSDRHWGSNVVDSGTIKLRGNIGVNDFAERLYWSLYNVSLLGAQTLMVAKEIAKLHPDMQVDFTAYTGYSTQLLPRFQISVSGADGFAQSLTAAYNLDYMIEKTYHEIKARNVIITVAETENHTADNYGFGSFALICKKFISQL